MATHSNILAWIIPWTEEPGGLQSTGSKKSGMTWRLNNNSFFFLMTFLFREVFRLTTKSTRKYRGFSSPSSPPQRCLCYRWWTYNHTPLSCQTHSMCTKVHSWCHSFCGFWQMHNETCAHHSTMQSINSSTAQNTLPSGLHLVILAPPSTQQPLIFYCPHTICLFQNVTQLELYSV